MRLHGLLFAAFAGVALAGCSTIRGTQQMPPALQPSAPHIGYDAALVAFNREADDLRGGLTRRRYRDYIIDLYLGDIDAAYARFKQQLASADRGSALAGDLVLLGLTGATALAGKSAVDELATITAVATGTRAAIDKRLFFDRTMPAVIAAIDARRAAIRAEIERKRQLSDEDYAMGSAIEDLRRLAAAGNINDAVDHITATATAEKVAAEARLAKIAEGCSEASEETAALNGRLIGLLAQDAAQTAARLKTAGSLLGVKPANGSVPTRAEIADAFDAKFCADDAGKRTFVELLEAKFNAGGGNGGD